QLLLVLGLGREVPHRASPSGRRPDCRTDRPRPSPPIITAVINDPEVVAREYATLDRLAQRRLDRTADVHGGTSPWLGALEGIAPVPSASSLECSGPGDASSEPTTRPSTSTRCGPRSATRGRTRPGSGARAPRNSSESTSRASNGGTHPVRCRGGPGRRSRPIS